MENIIKLLTQEQVDKLLSSGDGENYSPLGKFYVKNNIGFTAIDNSEGFAWCEDFDNIEEVENYLEGKIERKEELTMRNKNIETMKFYLNVQDTCVEWCSCCGEEIPLKADAIEQVCLYCGEKLLPCNLCDMDRVECYGGKCIMENKEIVTLHGKDNKVYRFQHKDLQRLLFYVFDYDWYVEDFLKNYTVEQLEKIINSTNREGIGVPGVAEVEEIVIYPKGLGLAK